jgi:tetratricopeptide (TPR) repeat protein
VITATELAAYVAPAVSALSHQTPAFGSMPGTEGGDFIFNLKHDTEFLNEDSAQLDDQAIKVNAELDTLRKQMREEERANEELRKQLATAEARLRQGGPGANVAPAPAAAPASAPPAAGNAPTSTPASGPASGPVADAAPPAGPESASVPPDAPKPAPARPSSEIAAAANDEGMRLYQEKRYADAAAKFMQASSLQPRMALYANNAGFAFFRMEEYDDAVKWFQKTVALDPKRAVAWLNLGDACVNLKRNAEARDAYGKYLALAPNGKSAPDVREKLQSLP